MRTELKTFKWVCDCCKAEQITMANAEYNSRPGGWITVSYSCGDWECRGGHESDFCESCVRKAQQSHKEDEDNHYGLILRNLKKK